MKDINRTDKLAQIFGMKIRTRIGYWNVRTMRESGRLGTIEKELKNYKVEIMGLSETRWNGFGELRTQEGNILIYSGHAEEDAPRRAGVALLMTSEARLALTEWKPISERIILARFKTKVRHISIIQCYAPTEEATDEEKTTFYEHLEATSKGIKKQDIFLLMGDINAKVGGNNEGVERIMGKHGLGVMNDNGNRFIDFCDEKELVIGGTLFPHKECHKVTWISPNGIVANQIDHIAISKKWRKSLLDVRARRGADCGSDHHLITADFRLKVASQKSQLEKGQTAFDSDKLRKKETAQEFSIELQNRFAALEMDTEDIENRWELIKNVIVSTSKKIVGYKRKRRKPWISEETLDKVEERKKLKEKKNRANTDEEQRAAVEEYNAKHREVKRSFRRDRRIWTENLAREAQEAAEHGNSKELYRITKTLANKKFASKKPIKGRNGETIVNEEKQLERWKEFFEELYSREVEEEEGEERGDGNELVEDQRQETDPRISIETPSRADIVAAIKEIKNGKSPGADNITPEMLKANPYITAEILYELLKNIWEKEEIPEDWKKGLLIKIPKKGDTTLCTNWRGITLLSVPSKILARIILNRIKERVEMKLRREQAGFRKDCSCIDLINTLRIVIEQCNEYQAPLYLSFVDFEKAFDSISRESMWRALTAFGMPTKITNLIKAIYRDYKCQVRHGGKLSEPFDVGMGVRQGCLLSPIIFLMVLDGVMKGITRRPRGLQWRLTDRLEDIDFADDLCLISQNINDMKEKLRDLQTEGKKVGLKINFEKTKEMRINTRNNQNLEIEGNVIKKVEHFQYLGSIVARSGGTDEDVTLRIKKAKGAFAQLGPVWRSNQIRQSTKLRIFETNVKSVLLYSCQTWKVTKIISSKLQVFINKCLRRIINIHWPARITNDELWIRTKQSPISEVIKKRKYGWLGHTLRRTNSTISRQALDWNPQGNRKRGRPKTTWRRSVEKEIKEEGKSWAEIKVMAQNRVRWRSFVAALRPPRD